MVEKESKNTHKSSGQSLKNSTTINNEYVQRQSGNFEHVFFLPDKLKLVLNRTYLTCLHRSKKKSQRRVIEPEPRMKILSKSYPLISILFFEIKRFSLYLIKLVRAMVCIPPSRKGGGGGGDGKLQSQKTYKIKNKNKNKIY